MADENKDVEARRFSDNELREFFEKFQEHEVKFQEHEVKELVISNQLLECQSDLTEAHKDLSNKIDKLSKDTQDMVDAWKAAQGTVKVAGVLGKVVKFLVGLAIAGWIAVEAFKHHDKFPK